LSIEKAELFPPKAKLASPCPSMTRPAAAGDLVEQVVLAHRLAHGQALDFLEGRGVIDHEPAVVVRHADQGVLAVAAEFHVVGGLAGFGRDLGDDLQRAFVDDLQGVLELAERAVVNAENAGFCFDHNRYLANSAFKVSCRF